jgi:uncharacterized protein YjbJ (UPF0337 family)
LVAERKTRKMFGQVTRMAKLKDKIVGKTKEVVAEVTADGKLAEEGKEQARKDNDPKPLGNLDKLT